MDGTGDRLNERIDCMSAISKGTGKGVLKICNATDEELMMYPWEIDDVSPEKRAGTNGNSSRETWGGFNDDSLNLANSRHSFDDSSLEVGIGINKDSSKEMTNY